MHSWLSEHVQKIERTVSTDKKSLEHISAEVRTLSNEVKEAARKQDNCCQLTQKKLDAIEKTLVTVIDKLNQLLEPPPEPPAVGFKITLANN